MNIKEFLKVFDSCPKIEDKKINIKYVQDISSTEEKNKRNNCLKSFRNGIFALAVLSCILWMPFCLVYGWISPFLLSIGPMLILSLSWILPTWKWFENTSIMLNVIIGLIPIRILAILAYILIINYLTPAITIPLVLFMIWHWLLFTSVEIISIMKMQPQNKTLSV